MLREAQCPATQSSISETTGFSPPKHHRILEIGVVEVSDDGEIERGYAPGNITKKTALVVAADPNSQSGEAAKARAYEIPMIDRGGLRANGRGLTRWWS